MTRLGSNIGSIHFTAVLGRGGMGEVYEGYDEKLQRRVAVKVIRDEHALSPAAKARFLHEARILSSIQHPNICLVHDYIELDGEAFLVMELIQGSTLSHALGQGLSFPRKLDIAIQVAEVMTVAHARGVVHRDLKPDNLMLTDDGQLKVLDFGIARSAPLAGPDDTTMVEGDVHLDASRVPSAEYPQTAVGDILGTPSYMSPEQARGEEVSPASDMYSLGLVFQRMFTNASPHESGLSKPDLLQKAQLGESLPVEGLTSELGSLIEQLKVQNPEARPTAAQAMARLRRLRGRPARRRRAAALAALVLIAALAGIKYAADLRDERAQAVAARSQAEASRDEAQVAQSEAEAMNGFLLDVLTSAGPEEAQGRDVTVREVLDQTARQLPHREDLVPGAKARFFLKMGDVYTSLGLTDDARSALESSLEIAAEDSTINPRTHMQSLMSLGHIEETLGNFDLAGRRYQEAADLATRKFPDDLQARATALNGLANIQSAEGDLEDAAASYEQVHDLILQVKGPDHPQTGMALGNLANLEYARARYERSVELNEEALRVFETSLGSDHPFLATVLNNMANSYETVGRLDDAFQALSRSLSIREKVLGPDHADTGQSMLNLAAVEIARGNFDEAQRLIDSGTKITITAFGADHHKAISAQLVAVELAQAQGNHDGAERLAKEAVATAAKLDGNHHVAASAPEILFDILMERSKHREAVQLANSTLQQRQAELGLGHEWVAVAWIQVARANVVLGNRPQARSALEAASSIGYDLGRIEEPDDLVTLAHEITSQRR